MNAATGRNARRALAGAVAALALGGTAAPAAAQWSQVHEQFYMPAEHNWVFRRNFAGADRLFNAFDYGHAILYEVLYTRPNAPASRLEEKEYGFLTGRLLTAPPRLPLEEGAIEVAYARLVPEAKAMFEWAHLLHRQIYDVLGDERLSQAAKDTEVAALLRYYRSRPELAFSARPKSMELMEGQHYSTAFREKYPRFNGLIWGYHWLQVGLYEPLMVGRTPEERQVGVTAAVTRFRQMLVNAPENMPRVMPMTAAIAPTFAARYPEAAIIFDNLHGMHDVISDILASPRVPRDRKREEILTAARRYRDDTSFVMTVDEWREMTAMMGVQNMGGPVMGFLEDFPEPTLPRGAVMASHAGQHGAAPAAAAAGSAQGHAGHAAAPAPVPAARGAMGAMDHSRAGASPARGMRHDASAHAPASAGADGMTALHERMMADPVIRARVAADPALRRMADELHGAGGMGMRHGAAATAADSARARAFVARLVADPQVEARIHAVPRLHQLWSDPAVQRRLGELRRQHGQPQPAAPEHRH
ncbi:MAG TPA: hypothetical protein VEX86_21625 [Longimicrobium sp.]|nr:hypothetical protein [Longimicrobium sp.]